MSATKAADKPEAKVVDKPKAEPVDKPEAKAVDKPEAEPPQPENNTATPPTTPPKLHSEIERLKLNWKQVIEQAPDELKRTPAIAILRSAGVKPVAIEDDTVVLAFKYPIHKERLETTENQQVARTIISKFLGRDCQVRCVHEKEDNRLVDAVKKIGAQVINVEEK
ncbi:hypothetical protein ES708_14406 [subsurface metagenome]